MPRLTTPRAIALLVLLQVVLAIPRLGDPIDLRYDGGVYYLLGTSLAEGSGFRLLSEPGPILGIQYPPGLPALVALHQLVLGTADTIVIGRALQVTYQLMCLGYVLALFAIARRFLGPGLSLLAGVLCSLSLHTFFLTSLLFAEIPFGVVSLAFVAVLDREGKGWTALRGLLALVSFAIRTAGLALLAGWVLTRLCQRRFRDAAVAAGISLAIVGSWQGYVSWVESTDAFQNPTYEYQRADYQYYNVSYRKNALLVDPFRPELGVAGLPDLVERALKGAQEMPMVLAESVSTTRKFWERDESWTVPIGIYLHLISLLILYGAWRTARRGELFLPLYGFCTAGLVCMTPWPAQYPRYLAPFTPFLALFLCITISELLGRPDRRASRRSIWIGALVVGPILLAQAYAALKSHTTYLIPSAFQDASGETVKGGRFFYPRDWVDFEGALAWVAENVPEGSVIATACPHMTYLSTGHKSVMPPLVEDVEEAQRLLDNVPVTHVIVDAFSFVDMSRRYAAPAIAAHPELWERVHGTETSDIQIYRRLP